MVSVGSFIYFNATPTYAVIVVGSSEMLKFIPDTEPYGPSVRHNEMSFLLASPVYNAYGSKLGLPGPALYLLVFLHWSIVQSSSARGKASDSFKPPAYFRPVI